MKLPSLQRLTALTFAAFFIPVCVFVPASVHADVVDDPGVSP